MNNGKADQLVSLQSPEGLEKCFFRTFFHDLIIIGYEIHLTPLTLMADPSSKKLEQRIITNAQTWTHVVEQH